MVDVKVIISVMYLSSGRWGGLIFSYDELFLNIFFLYLM